MMSRGRYKTFQMVCFVGLLLCSPVVQAKAVQLTESVQLAQDFRAIRLASFHLQGGDSLSWTCLLRYGGNRPVRVIAELRSPFVQSLSLEWVGSSGRRARYEVGAAKPFRERPLNNRYFAFPLELQAGEQAQLMLSCGSKGLRERASLHLYSEEEWLLMNNRRNAGVAAYFSAAIFTLVFGFIILAAIRANIRYSYVFYFSIGLLLVASLLGLGYQYLWPNQPHWQSLIKPLLLNATFLGGLRFLQRFFQTGTLLRKTDRIIYLAMILLGIFAALALSVPHLPSGALKLYQRLNEALFLFGAAVVIGIPLLYFRRTGKAEALGFLVAFIVLMSAVIAGIGAAWALYPDLPGLNLWIWMGILILHMVISALILQRVRRVVEDQARARRDLEWEKIRLLRSLVLQEELERERIGADLHDEAGSRFAAIKMNLSTMAWREREAERSRSLEQIIQKVDEVCDLNRTLSHRLLSVSLNQVGLPEALREYQLRLRKKGRHVVFRPSPGSLESLSETAAMLFYRVILELVEGIYESAQTLRVQIADSEDARELVLSVEPIDERLQAPDWNSTTLASLRTRLAIFNASREEPLQLLDEGLRIWLPKSIEAMAGE